MSGAEGPFDEFDFIRDLLRPLTGGALEALRLEDDVAILPGAASGDFPATHDLVVTTDAMVEGVHFLADDPPELVARKLLRVNLSDLAAKGAEPYAYFLIAAWPHGYPAAARRRFVQGLEADQASYGLRLFGGDTVSTPGPLTLAVTMLGRTPPGGAVLRKGARTGDRLLVSGTVGDGCLGLRALKGGLDDMPAEHLDYLAGRFRLPEPRLKLAVPLRMNATAAADVSDGLIADAGHIATASRTGVRLDLERLPLSPAARCWLDGQPDRGRALAELAAGGDDYEIVCAVPPMADKVIIAIAGQSGERLTDIGEFGGEPGVRVSCDGAAVEIASAGWRHG